MRLLNILTLRRGVASCQNSWQGLFETIPTMQLAYLDFSIDFTGHLLEDQVGNFFTSANSQCRVFSHYPTLLESFYRFSELARIAWRRSSLGSTLKPPHFGLRWSSSITSGLFFQDEECELPWHVFVVPSF